MIQLAQIVLRYRPVSGQSALMQGRPGEQNGRRPTLIDGSTADHAAGKFTVSHFAKWLEWFRAKKE